MERLNRFLRATGYKNHRNKWNMTEITIDLLIVIVIGIGVTIGVLLKGI